MPPSVVNKGGICLFEKGQKYYKYQKANERKSITKDLSERVEKYINPRNDPRIYWAREVTLDYGRESQCRVDYMVFKPVTNSVSGIEKGDFYCYEVKSSVEDFGKLVFQVFSQFRGECPVTDRVSGFTPYWAGWSEIPFKDVELSAGFSYMTGTRTMERLKRASGDGSLRWGWVTLNITPRLFEL